MVLNFWSFLSRECWECRHQNLIQCMSCWDKTQDFVHGRQALYTLLHIESCFCFKIGFCCVTQAGLKFSILPSSPECWDYRHIPSGAQPMFWLTVPMPSFIAAYPIFSFSTQFRIGSGVWVWNRGSVCSTFWSGTYYATQGGFGLGSALVNVKVLVFKECTTPGL